MTDFRSTQPVQRRSLDAAFRFLSLVVLLLLFAAFATSQVVALLSNTTLDGESAVVTNVIVEYLAHGNWRFPLFSHERYFPGVSVYMMHPPLHYFLAGIWVKAFGLGTWQLLAQSTAVGILGAGLAAWVAFRVYGPAVAYLVIALLATLFGFYFSTQQMRPDLALGANLALVLILFSRPLCERLARSPLALNSCLLGLAAIASLASHWHGFYAQAYLPLYLFVLYRSYGAKVALANAGFIALGVGAGLAAWLQLFGVDLPKSLLLAAMGGVVSKSAVVIPLRNALYPYVDWPGGTAVLVGLVLFAPFGLARAVRWMRSFRSKSIPLALTEKVDALLVLHLSAYVLFYLLAVGNHSAQYAANTYLLVTLAAARGYVCALGFIFDTLGVSGNRKRIAVPALAAAAAVGLCVGSPMMRLYLRPDLAASNTPNAVFAGFREGLKQFIPATGRTVIGGDVYPYLHDISYRSTAQIVSEQFLQEITGDDFFAILGRLVRQRKELNPAKMPAATYRVHLTREAETFVATDNTHSWQDYFMDPRVWSSDFHPVATVFIAVDHLGIPPVQDRWFLFRPRYFTVFSRAAASGPGASVETTVEVEGPIGLIRNGTVSAPHADTTNRDWISFSPQQRRDLLLEHLAHYRWISPRLHDDDLPQLADLLLPLIRQHFERYAWGDRVRYLGQAVEYAIANVGLVDRFPSRARIQRGGSETEDFPAIRRRASWIADAIPTRSVAATIEAPAAGIRSWLACKVRASHKASSKEHPRPLSTRTAPAS